MAVPSARLKALAAIAVQAGAVVMRHYAAGVDARHKDDRSPVTDADEEAEALILAELAAGFAGIPVIAEEEAAAGRLAAIDRHFFLVDPLDGTREFLNRNGEFTVNIAEVLDGAPIAGVVYAPAIGRLFAGDAGGAFEMTADLAQARAIAARPVPQKGLTAVGSRSHSDEKTVQFLKQYDIAEFRSAGSSLKFCLVAAGEADLYPRAGRTMEWDTAAGHAVLAAAGGSVSNWDGTPFTYGKTGFENPGFIARGK
ncbi:MAG: 3'(2'),5'-bisphosphate nucleotidase CysQ [Alphaproteobacteria bacterium]|nr:3'(2'),5'-bisphosphate nucleotidase CysQ [Alphaproteobacteria bacterium]